MIIMINGAFGSGKTSAAQMLQPLIPNGMIYDPEEVGYMLSKIIPHEMKDEDERTDDFQDMELWRVLAVTTAQELVRKYRKHLIVPMTIYKRANFDYISDGLRSIDSDTFHFCLLATKETIKQRVIGRGDAFGPWYEKQTEAGALAFRNYKFDEAIETDHIDTAEVVRIILRKISSRLDAG